MVLAGDRLLDRSIDNPHPEISFRTLFLPVWYEGYAAPKWVWQTTGGTDAFEPKMSLWPLIFGTLKATLYALLFSVPIALMAAVYVSQLAPPGSSPSSNPPSSSWPRCRRLSSDSSPPCGSHPGSRRRSSPPW